MITFDIHAIDTRRFWRKAIITPSGCLEWSGALNRDGYGSLKLRIDDRWVNCFAHRVAWVLAGYDLTPGLQLDHLCRNPRCVNVEHLDQVTSRINTSRSTNPVAPAIRARLAGRCLNGHLLSDVGVYANGQCAACGRAHAQRYKARQLARAS